MFTCILLWTLQNAGTTILNQILLGRNMAPNSGFVPWAQVSAGSDHSSDLPTIFSHPFSLCPLRWHTLPRFLTVRRWPRPAPVKAVVTTWLLGKTTILLCNILEFYLKNQIKHILLGTGPMNMHSPVQTGADWEQNYLKNKHLTVIK